MEVIPNSPNCNSSNTLKMELNFPMTLKLSDGDPSLVIDLAQPGMAEEFLEFFIVHLNNASPNNHIRHYDAPPPGSEGEKQSFERWLGVIRETLCSPYSLTVREQNTGRLVAVIYNRIETPTTELHNYPRRFQFSILNALTKDHNLFTLFKTDKVFEIAIVAVSSDYGKKGLATTLMELSIQIAIQNGAGAAQVEALSEYTARAASKLGFTVLKSIDYATFEYEGVTPLAGNEEMLSEHPAARFMARRLP